MELRIRIEDTQFRHSEGGSFGCGDLKIPPSNFSWYRGQDNINDIVFVTESMFHELDRMKEKTKVALLLECPAINPHSYEWIKENYEKFDYVLTHYEPFLKIDKRFIHYTFGGCWIKPEDWGIYPNKTKHLSIIASNKKQTYGHKLRWQAIEKYKDIADVYGRGHNEIDNKLIGLKDYKFSIAIENDDTWFTEKILDCFLTGVIPIYWGDKNIGKYFNEVGITKFDIKGITFKYDIYTVQAIKDNFERAKEFALPENLIYNNFIHPILGL